MLFANQLKEFKLNISNEKTVLMERPFITDITMAKIQVDELIDNCLSYQVVDTTANVMDSEDGDSDNEDNYDTTNGDDIVEKVLFDKNYWKHINANVFNTEYKAILKSSNVESKDIVNYTLARIC